MSDHTREQTTEKLEFPPCGIPDDFYPRRARVSDNPVLAVVAASGHNEKDALTIINNLNRLGWCVIRGNQP